MAYGNVKKEKKEHNSLLNLLKRHFGKDEDDLEEFDDEVGGIMKPMSEMKSTKRMRKGNPFDSDNEYEGDPEMYDDEESDDDEYEDAVSGEEKDAYDDSEYGDEDYGDEEESFTKPSKEQRKKMSIVVLGKKFSKPKRKEM